MRLSRHVLLYLCLLHRHIQSLFTFNNIQLIVGMGIGIVPPPPQAVKTSTGDEPTSYRHNSQATDTFYCSVEKRESSVNRNCIGEGEGLLLIEEREIWKVQGESKESFSYT